VVITTPGGTATGTGAYTYAAIPTVTSLSPTGGPVAGGTSVTITGTGFTGTSAVSFGGVAATFTVNTATRITATAPAHAAGTVNVVVTTPGGTATSTYTYVNECYGYGYHLVTLLDATVPGGDDVPFSYNGPFDDVTHTADGTEFTVTESGDYLINYGVSITAGVVGSAIALAVNGVVDESTNVPVLAHGVTTGSCVLTLSAGDTIALRNNSLEILTLAYLPSVGAQMSITKIEGKSNAYGYAYHSAMSPIDGTIPGGSSVPFNNNGPLSNVTHTAGGTVFTVLEAGDYLINYGANITAGVGSAIAIAVNGTVDPSTDVPVLATGEITGTCVLTLAAGDVIALKNNSLFAITLATQPSVGAQLSITRLDNYDAYGYVYHSAMSPIDGTILGGSSVPFSYNGPLSNVTHTAGGTEFTVLEAGDYLINYRANITAGSGSIIAIAVNGTVNPSTNVSVLGYGETMGSCIVTLAAGDTISLRNESLVALILDTQPSVGAQLNLIKLD